MALLYGEIYYMQRFKNIGIITVLGMPLKKYFRQEYVLIRHQYRKVNFYIAQYPNLRNIHSALHFTPLADLFNQTPSQLLLEACSHMLQLIREGNIYPGNHLHS